MNTCEVHKIFSDAKAVSSLSLYDKTRSCNSKTGPVEAIIFESSTLQLPLRSGHWFPNVLAFKVIKTALNRLRIDTFGGYYKLELLSLHSNQIAYIEDDTFRDLYSLKFLYLEYNKLTSINTTTFKGLTNLKNLYLHHNEIKFIDPGSFVTNQRLEYVTSYRSESDRISLNGKIWIRMLSQSVTTVEYMKEQHESISERFKANNQTFEKKLRECIDDKTRKSQEYDHYFNDWSIQKLRLKYLSETISDQEKLITTLKKEIKERKRVLEESKTEFVLLSSEIVVKEIQVIYFLVFFIIDLVFALLYTCYVLN